MLYSLIDKGLFHLFTQIGGKIDKFVYLTAKYPDLSDYKIRNNRDLCINYDKESCINNKHCHYNHDICKLSLTKELAIMFVNKVSEELIMNDHKTYEILQKEGYYVSDIVNYDLFDQKEGQKIVKSSNNMINNTLYDIFGKENIPTIGRRHTKQTKYEDINDVKQNNPIINFGTYTLQKIIPDNLSLFRAFSNGYNFTKRSFYDFNAKNLGYYSNIQTDMANYFKSKVIDYLIDDINQKKISKDLPNYIKKEKNFMIELINKISKTIISNSNCVIELYVLNIIYGIPIIVMDPYLDLIYVFDGNLIYDKFLNDKKNPNGKYNTPETLKNMIVLQFSGFTLSNIPTKIDICYY